MERTALQDDAVDAALDFVGVGGLSYDIVMQMDRLPAADGKYDAGLNGLFPGGFIANAVSAAARLGLRAGFAGWVGDDNGGELLQRAFADEGVDCRGLSVLKDEATPFCVIMISGSERAIIVPSFPLYKQTLAEAQLDQARRARVVITYPRDEAWCETVADAAHENGGLFALDVEATSPLKGKRMRALLDLADVIFLNEDSLSAVEASRLEDLRGPRWVIMTAGSRGAYALEPDSEHVVFQSAYPVRAIDTTGAGDCFHAALLAARLWGNDLPTALRFASGAAALKVQNLGARGGQPTREQVETLLEAWG